MKTTAEVIGEAFDVLNQEFIDTDHALGSIDRAKELLKAALPDGYVLIRPSWDGDQNEVASEYWSERARRWFQGPGLILSDPFYFRVKVK